MDWGAGSVGALTLNIFYIRLRRCVYTMLTLLRVKFVTGTSKHHFLDDKSSHTPSYDGAAESLVCENCQFRYHISCIEKDEEVIPNGLHWWCSNCL